MILAKFGQKLLAVENSAGIALGCVEADFLRFESSGIARRCAQPLPQHHFAILNKSAKIIFAYICLFHNRITFLAFSDRVFNFSPRRVIVEYSRCLSVCVWGEWRSARLSKKWWVLDPGGGCRAKSLQTQDSRLQDSKAHDAAVHWLCNDIAPSADGAAPDSLLFGDRQSLGRAVPGLSPMVRWKFKRRLHTCTSSCPGGCPLAARSKFAQRAALCTHSLSHKPCGRICRKRATPTLRSEDVKNSHAF